MPTFEYKAKLEPSWLFGIPFRSDLVIPGGMKSSFSVEAGSLRPVSHGTLPIYRRDEEKISLKYERDGVQIEFNDNFIYLNFESEDPDLSYKKAITIFDNVAQSLTLSTYQKFIFEIISGEKSSLLKGTGFNNVLRIFLIKRLPLRSTCLIIFTV